MKQGSTFGGQAHKRAHAGQALDGVASGGRRGTLPPHRLGHLARRTVAAVSIMALALVGSAPALATDEAVPPTDAGVAAASQPLAEPPAAEPPATPPAEPAPEPVPAEAPPAELPPAETPSAETPPMTLEAPAAEPVDDAASPPAAVPAPVVAPATEVDPPYLRWQVVDDEQSPVTGTAFIVQGPRDESVDDGGADEQWALAFVSTIHDNDGDPAYAGLDLDPTAGSFLVKQLADDRDPTQVREVADIDEYRLRVELAPTGFLTGEDVEWAAAAPTLDPALPPMLVELQREAPPVVARVVPPPQGGATVNVNLRTTRAGGVAATAGIQMQLYTNVNGGTGGSAYSTLGSAVAEAWATCTTDVDGDCSIVVPANRLGSQYWVLPVDIAGPSAFLSQYLVTGENTGSGSNRFALTPYSFRTPTLTANSTYNLPGSGTGTPLPTNARVGNPTLPLSLTTVTANRWRHFEGDMVASLKNNRFTPTCNVPPKIALIVDLSTSMTSNGNEGLNGAKAAATAFINALENKGAVLGIHSFGTDANPVVVSPALVTSGSSAGMRTSVNNMSVNGIQYTNWDKGLEQVSGGGYNLVIVLTDGNPTRYRNGSGNGSWTDMRGIEEAVLSANQLKIEGSQLMSFGVGAYIETSMPQNLQVVTGKNGWSGSGSIANVDYAITSSWTTVANSLATFAAEVTCTATVQVHKQLRALDGSLANGQGWTFTPTKAGQGTMTPAGAQVTNAVGVLPNPWSIKFDSLSDQASLTIAETQSDPNYQFDSVTCKNDGVDMAGIANAPTFSLSAIKSGDKIVCTVINKRSLPAASMKVDKVWRVIDGTGATIYDSSSGTGALPAGISAILGIAGPAPSTNPVSATWGEVVGSLLQGNVMTLSEQLTLQGLPGCRAVSATLTKSNGEVTNTPVGSGGVPVTLAAGLNTYEITNVINCETTLVLLKKVEGGGTGVPSNWDLSVTASLNLADETIVAGSSSKSNANTVQISSTRSYLLAEQFSVSGVNLAYLMDRLEVCTVASGSDPTGCATWSTVSDASAAVQVPLGQQKIYRFVNVPAPAVALPHTGGLSADGFGIGGASIAAVALMFAAVLYWRRTRRQTEV